MRVRTIRLTIGKRRLMFLSVREDARDVDQDRLVTSAARQSSSRASLHRHSPTHLILQPVALFLLPALRNSILLVASNSLQLTNEIIVSSGSASIVNE